MGEVHLGDGGVADGLFTFVRGSSVGWRVGWVGNG